GSVALQATRIARPKSQQRRIRRGWLVRRLLLAADILGLVTAFVATELLLGSRAMGGVGIDSEAVLLAGASPAWGVAAKRRGLYDHDVERAGGSAADAC